MRRNGKITYNFRTNLDYENCKDLIIKKFGYLEIMTWDERKEIALLDGCSHEKEVMKILTEHNGNNITDYKYK